MKAGPAIQRISLLPIGDLYFETPHGVVLAEMKSCDNKNVHSQVRKGVSQLFEYRYVYEDMVGRNPALILVIEAELPRNKAWLLEYLSSLGITLAWKVTQENTVVSSGYPGAA